MQNGTPFHHARTRTLQFPRVYRRNLYLLHWSVFLYHGYILPSKQLSRRDIVTERTLPLPPAARVMAEAPSAPHFEDVEHTSKTRAYAVCAWAGNGRIHPHSCMIP